MEDWETGALVSVPLDPCGMKSPNDVAEALYKAARKQRRTEDAIAPLMRARPCFCLTMLLGGAASQTCYVLCADHAAYHLTSGPMRYTVYTQN